MRVLLAAVGALASLALAPAASAATWCGGSAETATDRPDTSTGPQVHMAYAIPADGVDGFATYASAIATDVEESDAWWHSQDPMRTPRFDLAAFPGCSGFAAVDVSFVRLPLGSADLLASSSRASAIFRAMPGYGRWKKTVVYYDGPLDDPDLCGEGSGSASSGADSLAIVYVRSSCMRTQSLRAAVMTHELTHALGSPDGRQPHVCPGNSGHVCDAKNDLMYPVLSVGSLEEAVLDVNRDDYYRAGTGATDLSASQWLRHLETPQQPLEVTVSGDGTVTSDLPGVSCASSCTSQWDPGSRIVLSASPAPGERFVGWRGGCASPDCVLTLTEPLRVEAVFAPELRLRATVAGKGQVVGRGLACRATCATNVDEGFPFLLTAKPAAGWRFAGWGGECAGRKLRCTFVPKADGSVVARFVRTR
jgi:hypothetical protein